MDRLHVLIVDDYDAYLTYLKELLESQGCIVHAANRVRDALDLLDQGRNPEDPFPQIALLLVDLGLGGESGWEIVKRNRRAATDPLCVVLSGTTAPEDAARAADLKALFVGKGSEAASVPVLIQRAEMRKREWESNTRGAPAYDRRADDG